MEPKIIDAHAHCGIEDRYPPQSLQDYLSHIRGSGIKGAVMFSPVAEIYDRYDPRFADTNEWRQRRQESNEYLLMIGNEDFEVFPYFFIWNDFAVEQLTPRHRGIKWHRHSDEPRYHYDDPRCREAIEEIRRRNMPICLEEELGNTLRFINELAAGVRVVIPHLGFLNGGYHQLRKHGVFGLPNIYADTSLASPGEIKDYIERYGHERLMFGSDFPFGDPKTELKKIQKLSIPEEIKASITGLNVQRLLAESNRSQY